MRFRRTILKLKGFECRLPGLWKIFFGRRVCDQAERGIGVGQTGIGFSEIGIDPDRLFEMRNRGLEGLRGSLVPVIDSSQVGLLSLGIDGTHTRQASLVLRRQLDADLAGDVVSDVFLQD